MTADIALDIMFALFGGIAAIVVVDGIIAILRVGRE